MNKAFINRINLFSKKFNLRKYLIDKNIKYREVKSGEDKLQLQFYKCPFCNNINYKGNFHSNRLYVDNKTKLFLCYNCNISGNIVKLLSKIEGISEKDVVSKYIYGDYIELLPQELKILIKENNDPSPGKEDTHLPPVPLPSSFKSLFPFKLSEMYELRLGYKYLRDRGILKESTIKEYDIGYSDYIKRIIFPVWFKGKIVGWQGRDVTGKQEPKYLINKGFQKQKVIYNYDNIKNRQYITIVEGVIDAIKSNKINGTCLFGKNISEEQIKLLLELPNLTDIYICLDTDVEAQEAQEEICKKLIGLFNLYMIQLPKGKDPGDLSVDEMVKLKNNAISYNDNKIKVSINE